MQARDACCAGQTTEAEHRHPLHIRPETDASTDASFQRGHRDAGDGGRQHQIHIGRFEPGVVQRVEHRTRPEVDRRLDERVVGGREVRQLGVALDGQGQVAGRDLGAGVQALGHGVVPDLGQAQLGEQPGQLGLRVAMRRQGPVHGCNSRHLRPRFALARSSRYGSA